jgi:RNA polymerase sigma-70 factor (ECF subfamily)
LKSENIFADIRCYIFITQSAYPYMNHKITSLTFSFRDKIFRLALRILNNYDDAEDITQDILEKLWHKKNKINGYNSIEALSMKMTKDLCLDKLKHHKVKTEKLKTLAVQYTHEQQKPGLKNLVEITIELINKLPEKQRIIIHLRDVEGYDFNEIVSILDLDINAVRMNLSRARKTIKQQLEKISNYGL